MSAADAVVIGAGPAGLAAAQQLQAAGLKPIIFDKADTVGAVWRRHYDRLHLHTPRSLSGLPGLPMPAAYGRYPSRAQFVEYLELYAGTFDLKPIFGVQVRAVRRAGEAWRVEAGERSVEAPIVVVATGWADFPNSPQWPGMEAFEGPVSALERLPQRRALSPASGCWSSGSAIRERRLRWISAESGAAATLAVRSPVRVLPRDLFGLPILSFSVAQRFLPARLADAINAPIIRLAIGPLEAARLQGRRQGTAAG